MATRLAGQRRTIGQRIRGVIGGIAGRVRRFFGR